MLWGLFWISTEYYGWDSPHGTFSASSPPTPTARVALSPFLGETPSFHPAARTTYFRDSDNIFGFQLKCVLIFFSCFSENLAIGSLSKKVQSNHLDHVLDPPKPVKSRTKSFWFPPLTGKKSTPFWGRMPPSLEGECPLLVQSSHIHMQLKSRVLLHGKGWTQMPERQYF